MRVHVKVAKTPKEIDGVFQVRHKVFIEEDGKFPSQPDKRLYDFFDTIPSTVNIIAMVDDTVIGCLRMTELSEAGLPADHYFNFKPYLTDNIGKLASVSMFCLLSEYRSNMQLAYMLISMGCYWGISHDITHIITPINPDIASLIKRVGFKPLCEEVISNVGGLPIIPMMLQVSELRDSTLQYVKRMKLDQFIDIFEREFYEEGDRIITLGETGETAYVVVEGSVKVTKPGKRPGDQSEILINELGRGEMFGELALLTAHPRTANITAATDVDLMVLNKDVFQKEVLSDPKHMHSVLEMLSNRLAGTLDLLANPDKK
ncbi:cyclic nucleotide-binding domain-containing protein [Thermodesulfobacteriota bacterium]